MKLSPRGWSWIGLSAFCACVYAAARYDMRLFAVALGLGVVAFVAHHIWKAITSRPDPQITKWAEAGLDSRYQDYLNRRAAHVAEKPILPAVLRDKKGRFVSKKAAMNALLASDIADEAARKYEMAVQK